MERVWGAGKDCTALRGTSPKPEDERCTANAIVAIWYDSGNHAFGHGRQYRRLVTRVILKTKQAAFKVGNVQDVLNSAISWEIVA